MRNPEVHARTTTYSSRFIAWIFAAAALGAAIRLIYLANFPTKAYLYISGDGIGYHLQADHLANGRGYVNAFNAAVQTAHHPPGWTTVLAGVSKLGGDTIVAHQRVGVALGLVLIVLTAWLAAHLFGERTGIKAGFLAALYPGFWVLEAQVLSEPLALVLLAVSLLLVFRLVGAPSLPVAILVGISIGLGILVRSEQAVVFAIVIPAALARAPGLTTMRRVKLGGVIGAIAIGLLVPWATYNTIRFEQPVLLSMNAGATLLAGNCDTFSGDLIGFYDVSCNRKLGLDSEGDRSVMDRVSRAAAIDNIMDNLDHLPLTMLARLGRMTGLYAPGQTVELVAAWHGTSEWPVWLWIVSFWPLAVLAVYGGVSSRHTDVWLLPLLVPIVLVVGIVLVFYGEPRYHTPSDLGIVILAASGLTRLTRRSGDGSRSVSA
jgi:4-amino-4-deoxy-L-arabinose transferase-like glycosyltransferase